MGYTPWGCKETDRTERLIHTQAEQSMHTYICLCICACIYFLNLYANLNGLNDHLALALFQKC